MRLADRFPFLVRIFEAAGSGLLLLAIFLLPITSLPRLSKLMGGTLVAPPAIITLFVACPIWLFLFFLRREKLQRETLPWLAFIGAGLLSSALAFFLPLPPFRDFTPMSAEVSALLTFAIGAACYIVFATWYRKEKWLVWALRAINLSGLLLLFWSLAQLYIILVTKGNYPGLMVQIQSLISIRPLTDHVYYMRVSGFAYEPSWLGHQLNTVYLPVWLAASITGYSSFRKLGRVSIENLLMLGGFVILVFTYSRISLLGILLALAYGIYQLNRAGIRRLRIWLVRHGWRSTRGLGILIGILVFFIYATLILGLLILLAHQDARIARLLAFKEVPTSLLDFSASTDFAERVIYWLNGWQVFARYPIFGVGLGNAGFYFVQNLPAVSLRYKEILQVVYQALELPNVKSFWIRLLSETGVFGMSLFMGWYVLLWNASRRLITDSSNLLRMMGWMGSIVLLTFLTEGFSIDSFALPYIWISLGLVSAASTLARDKSNKALAGKA
jgi:hypothetical protein